MLRSEVLVPNRTRRLRWLAPLVVAMFASGAIGQWGASGSLYTETGIEVSLDARVIGVFGMLNGLGYDHETSFGPPPLLIPLYSDARVKARSSLGRPGQGLKKFASLVKKADVPAANYGEAVLQLGSAPQFEATGRITKLAMRISPGLRTWFNEEGGAAIHRQVTRLGGSSQKELHKALGTISNRVRSAVRLGDEEDQLLDDTGPAGRVVVVFNPLDAHGTLHRAKVRGVSYVIAGPFNNDAQRQRAAAAANVLYARTLVQREAGKATKGSIAETTFPNLSKKARRDLKDAEGLAAELLACAVVQALASDACALSWAVEDPSAEAALKVVAPRVKAWLSDTTLLQEAATDLLKNPPVAPAEPSDGGTLDAGSTPTP